jgi:hypothetical protein
MTNSISNSSDQSRPRTALLRNGFEFNFGEGYQCRHCTRPIRAIDAEVLDGAAMRLVCDCGHVFITYERRS